MAGPERDAVRVQVTRDLGLYDIVMLGRGPMGWAGRFVLVGSAARVAGVATILGIGMAAFVVALNALAYAELAGSRPDVAGGGYGWVREALPPPSGFLSGWFSWAGHLAAAALCAAGIGLFLDYALPGASGRFLGLPPNPLLVGGPPRRGRTLRRGDRPVPRLRPRRRERELPRPPAKPRRRRDPVQRIREGPPADCVARLRARGHSRGPPP